MQLQVCKHNPDTSGFNFEIFNLQWTFKEISKNFHINFQDGHWHFNDTLCIPLLNVCMHVSNAFEMEFHSSFDLKMNELGSV